MSLHLFLNSNKLFFIWHVKFFQKKEKRSKCLFYLDTSIPKPLLWSWKSILQLMTTQKILNALDLGTAESSDQLLTMKKWYS